MQIRFHTSLHPPACPSSSHSTYHVITSWQVSVPAPELPLQPSFDPELGYNRYLSVDGPSGWATQ